MWGVLIHPYFLLGLFFGGSAGFVLAAILASSHDRQEETLERMEFDERAKKHMKAGTDVG